MKTHGGNRPGAGRKKINSCLKRETISIRLPAWLIKKLRHFDSDIGPAIEEAVIKHYKFRQPGPKKSSNPSGRKLTSGRYESREELERMVLHKYFDTDLNQSEIARICRVSQPTVSKILSQPRRG